MATKNHLALLPLKMGCLFNSPVIDSYTDALLDVFPQVMYKVKRLCTNVHPIPAGQHTKYKS
jgi:hypothetical protein